MTRCWWVPWEKRRLTKWILFHNKQTCLASLAIRLYNFPNPFRKDGTQHKVRVFVVPVRLSDGLSTLWGGRRALSHFIEYFSLEYGQFFIHRLDCDAIIALARYCAQIFIVTVDFGEARAASYGHGVFVERVLHSFMPVIAVT